MATDNRIELRIAADDKVALSQRAEAEGVTLSTLLRRGIRSVLGKPVRLEGEDALEVVALRRRVNAMANRLDELGRKGGESLAMRRDIAQVRADAGRCWGAIDGHQGRPYQHEIRSWAIGAAPAQRRRQ